jgi:hypothetical protein
MCQSSLPGRAFDPPGDAAVIFDERSEGDYRIYAGALEAREVIHREQHRLHC